MSQLPLLDVPPVLVGVGSRVLTDAAWVASCMSEALASMTPAPSAVWSGDCRGADACVLAWARSCGLVTRLWAADWEQHGAAAGPRRSRAMLAACPAGSVVCVFFVGPRSQSRGSLWSLRFAHEFGLAVRVYEGGR